MSKIRSALHAATFVPLANIAPQSSKLGNLYGSTDLSSYINGVFAFAIGIGAVVAVLRLAYAGFLYMGSDMWTSKGKAREVIGDVVLGLFLLLAIWLILNQINPDILKLQALKNIQAKPVPASTGASPASSAASSAGSAGTAEGAAGAQTTGAQTTGSSDNGTGIDQFQNTGAQLP